MPFDPTPFDPKEIERMLAMSEDELFEQLGREIMAATADCLNEALVAHGGRGTLVNDGTVHDMAEFIDPDKLGAVLETARRLAEERNLPIGNVTELSDVITDNDALTYVLGPPSDTAS